MCPPLNLYQAWSTAGQYWGYSRFVLVTDVTSGFLMQLAIALFFQCLQSLRHGVLKQEIHNIDNIMIMEHQSLGLYYCEHHGSGRVSLKLILREGLGNQSYGPGLAFIVNSSRWLYNDS
jgi:hypothetical protein